MVMALGTGEVLGWFIFLIVISLLFFAAFGGNSINEKTIEEYIDSLLVDEYNNPGEPK
jgi:hypothetical protein